jgi:hypothetical protein
MTQMTQSEFRQETESRTSIKNYTANIPIPRTFCQVHLRKAEARASLMFTLTGIKPQRPVQPSGGCDGIQNSFSGTIQGRRVQRKVSVSTTSWSEKVYLDYNTVGLYRLTHDEALSAPVSEV